MMVLEDVELKTGVRRTGAAAGTAVETVALVAEKVLSKAESTHSNLTLNANGVPDGNPVMSHLVVACTTDKEVHPDGVPEPPTFVSTNQLLKTHPIPKALAFQVNVSQTGAGRS